MIDYILKQKPKALICQDYILADVIEHNSNPVPILVQTDGCTGGVRTELGAQLLCHLSVDAVKTYVANGCPSLDILREMVLSRLVAAKEHLKVGVPNLLATLQILFVVGTKVHLVRIGDGTFFATRADKSLTTSVIDYEPNMPNYLAYQTEERTKNELKAATQGAVRIETFTSAITEYTRRGPYEEITLEVFDLEDRMYIGLASDGVGSYVDSANTALTVTEVMTEMTAIKSTEGEFVKRRFHKMHEGFAKRGFVNYDDVAVVMLDVTKYKARQR